jgi:hypothetical protein
MDQRRKTREWLHAEQEGREDIAELTFARLMSELPPIEPSEAFVAAVVHHAMQVHARRQMVHRLARIAAIVLVCAVSIAAVWVLGSVALGALAGGTALLSDGLLWLVRSAGAGIKWWSLAARVGGAIGDSLITPRTATAIVTIELLGMSAIYALHRVLRNEGSSNSQQVHI